MTELQFSVHAVSATVPTPKNEEVRSRTARADSEAAAFVAPVVGVLLLGLRDSVDVDIERLEFSLGHVTVEPIRNRVEPGPEVVVAGDEVVGRDEHHCVRGVDDFGGVALASGAGEVHQPAVGEEVQIPAVGRLVAGDTVFWLGDVVGLRFEPVEVYLHVEVAGVC